MASAAGVLTEEELCRSQRFLTGVTHARPSATSVRFVDTWAIEKAKEALSGVKALLAASPPEPFS